MEANSATANIAKVSIVMPKTKSGLRQWLWLIAVFVLSCPVFAGVNVVGTNSDLVLTINGNKVFGLAVSPGPAVGALAYNGNDALDELRSGGIQFYRMPLVPTWKTSSNTLSQTMLATNQAALDWCAQHGMLMLFNLNDLSWFSSSDTTTPVLLTNLLGMFSTHPGMGMYKSLDEAWWGTQTTGQGTAANLTRAFNIIHSFDPLHPVEQTHAPRGTVPDLQPYNAAADILMIDDYPVVTNGTVANNPPITNTNVSQFGDWTHVLSQVANNERNFWMVEQIAFSGTTPPSHALVFPTFQQERFMAYQSIVNGARGLMFFGGNISNTLAGADLPLLWNWSFWTNVLKPLTLELSPGSPVFDALVAADSPLPMSMSGTTSPDVEFRLRESGTNIYLLASKREGATANATFGGLPDWATNATVLFENRTITASNNSFTDSFAQWDVHIYKFDYPGAAPFFTSIPSDRTNFPTSTEVFVADAIAPTTISWQWRKDGTNLADGGNISGSSTPKLTVSNLSGSDIGNYDVIATCAGGSITSAPPAFLQVLTNVPPAITSQPQSHTNLIGTTATFSVNVYGTPPFSYQWRKNATNLVDGNNVSGSLTPNLAIANVSSNDAATYDVVVSGVGSVTSDPATLSLLVFTNNLILYEPFAYDNIGSPVSSNTPANWAFNGSGANDLNVTSNSLSYLGLADSIGNSVTNGGAGLGTRRLFGTAITNGQLYFSALFRMNKVGYGTWNGSDSQIGALTAPDNTSFRLQIMAYAWSSDGSYEIDFEKGGTGAYLSYAAFAFEGETLFFVGKYDFTVKPNLVTLWVNPNPWYFGRDIEPPANAVNSGGADTVQAIDRFNMRQNTAASVPANMQWDELRVGRTWASVTPPGAPVPIQAPMLNSEIYSDSTSTNLLMYWPINIGPFTLESSSAIDGSWQRVDGVINSGDSSYIFVPFSDGAAFYRLHMAQ